MNPLAVFALGVAAWVVGQAFGLTALRIAAKPVPLVALAVWTAPARERWLTAGLLLSAVGDLVMELGSAPAFFLGGMAAFAAAHLAYVVGFTRRAREWRPAALVLFLVWGALLLPRLWPGLGGLRLPVAVYAALLLAMMWRAAAAALATGRRDTLLGAVLFGISDSLIALDRFDAPVPGARWLIMAAYWAGQYLIARSARPA